MEEEGERLKMQGKMVTTEEEENILRNPKTGTSALKKALPSYLFIQHTLQRNPQNQTTRPPRAVF